jgi:LDH2 family malate/lactate/ureidoglycolate dehydrogenase
MSVSPRIDATRLIDFATAVYASAGLPEADARLVADTLVQADLWGHQSHGVLRLGWYLDRLRHGVMHPVTTPEIVVDAGAIAVIDGHDGVGQVLAMRATHEAITRARAHGIGAVAVRHSNHFGTCMYYTRCVAAAGCVGSRAPFVVDMAATGVARGKIYLARHEHRPIPLGWAPNQAGEPTTDPREALDGLILPMAEHKGYALAAMVDMLSGVFTGSGFLSAVHSPYQTTHTSHCGHLLIAMDIARFQPLEEFTTRMEAFVDEIKAAPLAKGFDEVFYPGEIEDYNDAQCRREGLALPEDTRAHLRRIAQATGLVAQWPC